jgi:AcrR family transcriptional regulator
MLSEALEQWVDDIDAQLVILRTGSGDAWERLQALLIYIGSRIGERSESWRMWLDFAGAALKDPELRRYAARSQQRWVAAIADTVTEGDAAGVFVPVIPATEIAEILSALFDGFPLQVFAMESDISGAEATARLIDVARALLRPLSA